MKHEAVKNRGRKGDHGEHEMSLMPIPIQAEYKFFLKIRSGLGIDVVPDRFTPGMVDA